MAVANKVVQGFFPHGLSRLTEAVRSAPVQPRVPHGAALQQRPSTNGSATQLPPSLSRVAAGGGDPLPPQVRAKMEAVFGTSFADVRVHVGGEAPAIGALAFTSGSHIHFAPGQYNPHAAHGQRLLGHELTHVVQQRAGRVQNPFGAGIAVVHDVRLEAEAERMAARVASAPEVVQPTRLRAALAGGVMGAGASAVGVVAAPVLGVAAAGALVGVGIYESGPALARGGRALASGARVLWNRFRGPAQAPAMTIAAPAAAAADEKVDEKADEKADEKVTAIVSPDPRLSEITRFFDTIKSLELNESGANIRNQLRVKLAAAERSRRNLDALITFYGKVRSSSHLQPIVRSAPAAAAAASASLPLHTADEKHEDGGGDDEIAEDDAEQKSTGPRRSAIKATGTGGLRPRGNFVPTPGSAKKLKSWSKAGNAYKALAEIRGKYRGVKAVLHVHLNADGQRLSSHSGASIFYASDEKLESKPRQVYWDGAAVSGDLQTLLDAGFGGDSWRLAAGYPR